MRSALFEVVVQLELIPSMDSRKSILVSTSFALDVSVNVDKSVYFDKDGNPTAEGAKVITSTLVQGLSANIHMANQKGFIKDFEHIQQIIDQLQKGFVTNVEMETREFKTISHGESENTGEH